MPWRTQPEPYRVWISEVMLQQTQVDTVIPYFTRFLELFPDVQALAAAEQQTVLKVWEGLGYYRRARNLQKAAQILVRDHDGQLPRTFAALRDLPGIGDYTAAAIASIAFGEAVPVVDGNVLRVATRFYGLCEDIRKPATRRGLFQRLLAVLQATPAANAGSPRDAERRRRGPRRGNRQTSAHTPPPLPTRDIHPGDFNQALMELGALVCVPRKPHCAACPLAVACLARRTGRTAELPMKSKTKPLPHYTLAVGVVWKNGKVLIGRRRPDQMLGGLWEFPGGKQLPHETLAETVSREVREETGLAVEVGPKLATIEHGYSHFTLTLTAFTCRWLRGRARPTCASALKWVRPAALSQYPFPTANRKFLHRVQASAPSDACFSSARRAAPEG